MAQKLELATAEDWESTLALGDPIDAGKGIKLWLIVSPSGTTHIAESETGAFVGTDLDQVIADIAEADEAVMKRQLADAKDLFKSANHLPEDKFWAKFK